MSDGAEFLARLVAALNEAGMHMVAGSFASTHHGVPRATQDIDLVIDPTGAALKAFVAGLSPEVYYVSEDVRKARPFSVEELRRRLPVRLLGVDVFVATPEDTILTKLERAAMSGSDRQLRDVAGVLEVKRGELDVPYIERWAADLGVLELWWKVVAGSGQQA